jgi:hypothetical protein
MSAAFAMCARRVRSTFDSGKIVAPQQSDVEGQSPDLRTSSNPRNDEEDGKHIVTSSDIVWRGRLPDQPPPIRLTGSARIDSLGAPHGQMGWERGR